MSFRVKYAIAKAYLININYFVTFTVSDASIQLSYSHDTSKGIFQDENFAKYNEEFRFPHTVTRLRHINFCVQLYIH